MPSSLVKYVASRRRSNGQDVHWARLDLDRLPFRGNQPPYLRQEEYDERVVRVADARNSFFDVTIPAENQQYLDVLDAWANGWFQLIHLERFFQGSTRHYIEWVEYYLEDGSTRTPYQTQTTVELERGQSSPYDAQSGYPA